MSPLAAQHVAAIEAEIRAAVAEHFAKGGKLLVGMWGTASGTTTSSPWGITHEQGLACPLMVTYKSSYRASVRLGNRGVSVFVAGFDGWPARKPFAHDEQLVALYELAKRFRTEWVR